MATPRLKKAQKTVESSVLPAGPGPARIASRKNPEIRDANRTLFEGRWKQIRGKSMKWWNLINERDLSRLDKSHVKLDKYVVLLQVKYGYTKQHAREEINKPIEER